MTNTSNNNFKKENNSKNKWSIPDDIPIQDDQSVPPLTSISEEDGGDKQQSQIGSRNIGIRSSKEGGVGAIKAQAQKALIAGFKKVIDKDKDKEKDKDNTSTPKSSLVTKNGSIDMSASSGIVSGGTSLASNITSTDSQVNKSQTVIPPKVPVRRDKRASIQINEIQTDHIDKNSPSSSLLSQSQKSSISSGMITGAVGSASSTPSILKHNKGYNDSVNINKKDDIIQMQILANGKSNFIINENNESSVTNINQSYTRVYDSVDSNFYDASDSVDSSEVSLPMPPEISRPSITAIINTNIMELQQQQQQLQQQQQQQNLQQQKHQNEHIDQQHPPKPRIQSEV